MIDVLPEVSFPIGQAEARDVVRASLLSDARLGEPERLSGARV